MFVYLSIFLKVNIVNVAKRRLNELEYYRVLVSTTTKTDLTKSYFDLGMTTISQPLIADFSRITDQQGLSVSTVP